MSKDQRTPGCGDESNHPSSKRKYDSESSIIKIDHLELFTEDDKSTIAETINNKCLSLARPKHLGYF